MNQNLQHGQRGVGIAELMIALTIGLLVTMAVSTLFINTRQNYKQNDATSKVQENARYAMDLITTDLRHAGFLGNFADPSLVDTSTMTLLPPAQDCTVAGTTSGLYNFAQPNLMLSFGNQITDVTTMTFYGTCLAAADNVKPKSSVLIVKRVAGQATLATNLIANTPYIYTNGSTAFLFTQPSAVAPPVVNGQYWEYQPRIYYIDNTDHLSRKQLSNLSLVSEPLADGIEAFHIDFGIDSNTTTGKYDGTPDYFYTPVANTDPSTANDLNSAVSATVYVLARTPEPDPDVNYKDTKTYQLGPNVTMGPFSSTDTIPFNGQNVKRWRFHHRVYSTTVVLKNIRNQEMVRQ